MITKNGASKAVSKSAAVAASVAKGVAKDVYMPYTSSHDQWLSDQAIGRVRSINLDMAYCLKKKCILQMISKY